MVMPSMSGSWESLAIVSASVVAALTGAGWTCWIKSFCLNDGTCQAVNESGAWPGFQCSFRNVVPLVSVLIHENASYDGNVAGLTRDYCSVGERLHLSSVTGDHTCMLFRPYPDALHREVMRPSASTYHEKACGEWLDNGMALQPSLQQRVEYLAFADHTERADEVRTAEAAMHSGTRLSAGNMGKFRADCQRAVLGGSAGLRYSGKLVYAHLLAQADVDAIVDESTALRSLGMIVGHYCDAPVLFGWEMSSDGYRASVRPGSSFSTNVLASALNLVDASFADQAAAEAGNAHVNFYATRSPEATLAQLTEVLAGGTLRTVHTDANVLITAHTPELDGFIHLLGSSVVQAKAYVKGLAAMCSFSMQNSIDYIGYTAQRANSAASQWIANERTRRPAAVALGHLAAPADVTPLLEVNTEHVVNASTITLSQLVGAQSGDSHATCLEFTRALFPDEIDVIHHDLVISNELYARMETTVASVRAAVASVLRTNPHIRAAIYDADAIATDVEATRIRIPGAPRGTWAGSTRPVPYAAFNSNDGVFVMAAKQARIVWLDRQRDLVYDATSPCEGPASYDPLTPQVRHPGLIHPKWRLTCDP